jgi:hypothetical protein
MEQTDHAATTTTAPLGVSQDVLPDDHGMKTSSTGSHQNDKDVIAQLALLSPMEYDRVRTAQAKALGIQLKTLDDLVKAARHDEGVGSGRLPFSEVEPYPEPIDPALVLDELAEIIPRYVVMEKEQVIAAVLWIAMTWFIGVVKVAPLAIITAPEKACGKSQLIELFKLLVARPLSAANSTASFLFRAITAWSPTLLIDEADTFIRENEELKGIVNAGHTRASAYVGRTVAVGDGHEPQLFFVWGAKAFAGIALEKHLPDSTMSRGVVYQLRRKMKHESVSRLRYAEPGKFTLLASKLARFADDYSSQVQQARPVLPDELSDRAQDNWESLLAIAECAGPVWLQRATDAALIMSAPGEESVSTGNELLADIKDVFERVRVEKISSAELIEALCNIDDGGWATYNRGKALSPRQLAKQLAGYGIRSKTVRLGKFDTPKGYDAAQFADAFARYLSPSEKLPPRCNDAPEPSVGMAEDVADKAQQCSQESVTLDTLLPLDCCGVADVAANAGGAHGAPEEAF